jgi:hypothetical protein
VLQVRYQVPHTLNTYGPRLHTVLLGHPAAFHLFLHKGITPVHILAHLQRHFSFIFRAFLSIAFTLIAVRLSLPLFQKLTNLIIHNFHPNLQILQLQLLIRLHKELHIHFRQERLQQSIHLPLNKNLHNIPNRKSSCSKYPSLPLLKESNSTWPTTVTMMIIL